MAETIRTKWIVSAVVLAIGAWAVGPLPSVSAFGQASTDGATLKLTGERLGQGKISPYQCGQFIEYLCADPVHVRREGL